MLKKGIVMKSFNQTVTSSGRRIAAAAVLAAALVSPSLAADPVLGPGDSIVVSSAPGVSGSFLHLYPFILSATSGINYITERIDFPLAFEFTSFAATLFSGATPIASGVDVGPAGPLIKNTFLLGSLGAGAYELRISGFGSGTSGVDSYDGQLLAIPAIAAAVPEPEIWAMMLVGVGLVGMRLRRKSRLDGAKRFA